MATRSEASAVKDELFEKLYHRFNHASFPLIGGVDLEKTADGYGLQVTLKYEPRADQTAALQKDYAAYKGVPVSYVQPAG